jgi:hypothetical protein
MKQLTQRYGGIVVDLDKGAPTEAQRKAKLARLGVINAELNQCAATLEQLADMLRRYHFDDLAKPGTLDGILATLIAEHRRLTSELQRRAVRLVHGRRGTPSEILMRKPGTSVGIVVGEGDTKAAALADAARRVGKS